MRADEKALKEARERKEEEAQRMLKELAHNKILVKVQLRTIIEGGFGVRFSYDDVDLTTVAFKENLPKLAKLDDVFDGYIIIKNVQKGLFQFFEKSYYKKEEAGL